jgi:hypothetical protein
VFAGGGIISRVWSPLPRRRATTSR